MMRHFGHVIVEAIVDVVMMDDVRVALDVKAAVVVVSLLAHA